MLTKRVHRSLFLLALVGLAGCITPITDRQWVRVETENFLLYSQLSETESVTLGEKLETFREVTRTFTSASSAAFEPVIPTIAYVFDSAGAYRKFAPPRYLGATEIDDQNVYLAAVAEDRFPTFQYAPLLPVERLMVYARAAEGAPMLQVVLDGEHNSKSHELADCFGIRAWDFNSHKLDPLGVDLERLKTLFDAWSIERFLAFRAAGYDFYFMPNG